MTALTAISYGMIAGSLLVLVGVYLHLRQAKPKQRELLRRCDDVELLQFRTSPESTQPMPVLTERDRAEGWVVKNLGGMDVKVLDIHQIERIDIAVYDSDPWDEDEPTRLHGPEEKS